MATKASFSKKFFAGSKWQENFTGLILAAVVIVVIGLLVFNYLSGRDGQPTGPTPQKETPTQAPGKESGFQPVPLPTTHKVSAGDSLAKLSLRYYNSTDFWPGLAKINQLDKPSLIEPNQEIKIPQEQDVQNVTVEDLAPKDQGPITGNSYTVQYGDTLAKIAQRAYGDWSQWHRIDEANHVGRLPNSNPLIHSGNVLVIPR